MRQYWAFVSTSWPLLAFGFLGVFWASLGQSFFISWFGLPIQGQLGLSAGVYGSIYSAATVCSGIIIVLFGGLIDRWPLPRFVICVAVGLCCACLAMGSAQSATGLFFGFFLIRLFGQGFFPHTAQTTMARHFELNRGKALSISASGAPTGEVIMPVVLVMLIASVGWRYTWWIMALSVPFMYLPLAVWLLRKAKLDDSSMLPATAKNASSHKAAGRREMLRDYRFWLALPAVVAGPFLVTGVFIQFGFVIEQKQWDPVWVASCFIMLGSSHWVTSLSAGVLVDRFTATSLLPILPLPLIAAAWSLIVFDGDWFVPVFMALLGANMGLSAPIVSSLWAENYGTRNLGSIRSLMTGIMIFATALAPVSYGLLIDRGVTIFVLFGSLGLGACVAVFLTFFSYSRTHTDNT